MTDAVDFYYDDHYLSEFGFTICSIDNESNGVVTVSNNNKLTFNRVAKSNGKRFSLVSSKYEGCYTANFMIAKVNTDAINWGGAVELITDTEYNDIARWLNQRSFKPVYFEFATPGHDDHLCRFNASFNLEKVYINNSLRALRVTMETDSPFPFDEEREYSYTVTDISEPEKVWDSNYHIGNSYPDVVVTVHADGDFWMRNETNGCYTEIKNCVAGEVITIKGTEKIITTSNAEHEKRLWNDFNFEYFSICNTMQNVVNTVYFGLPCKVVISYCPQLK